MRMTRLLVAITLLIPAAAAAAAGGPVTPRVLNEEMLIVASERTYWPGFDPTAYPLAIYDGARTWLFRHPAPPDGFSREGDVFIWQGRHPAVVANSSAGMGGISTATVLLESLGKAGGLREQVAVVVHETFHVFQATTGRRWGADEMALFLYPVDDADLLALRRIETEALRRALAAESMSEAAGWARCAVEAREQRFDCLDESSVAYERGIESMEGTAAYIQYLIAGSSPPSFLDETFSADDVRNRAYWTGVAFALLLDRFSPNWKTGFGGDSSRFLDSDLRQALEGIHARSLAESERAAIALRARADVRKIREQRSSRRERFLSRHGWRIVFEADNAMPLWPKGFDPLNVQRVDGGILHTRFLRVGNESGRIEVMDGQALTEGVGPHPLFNGIRRLIVTGLQAEPAIVTDGERLEISAPPCTVDLSGAEVTVRDSTVTVRLAGEKPAQNQGQ
jgi:hypothetical protein